MDKLTNAVGVARDGTDKTIEQQSADRIAARLVNWLPNFPVVSDKRLLTLAALLLGAVVDNIEAGVPLDIVDEIMRKAKTHADEETAALNELLTDPDDEAADISYRRDLKNVYL